MVGSQNIYEYNKLKTIDLDCASIPGISKELTPDEIIIKLVNKINELIIEYNHLAKDLELYKKAFKRSQQIDVMHVQSVPYIPPSIFPEKMWGTYRLPEPIDHSMH